MKRLTPRQLFTTAFMAVLVLACGAAAAGYPIVNYVPVDVLAGLSAIGMIPFTGEVEMKEVKELIEKQGKAWEKFKETNDARLKAIEEGKGVAELEGKLATMNTELTAVSKELKEVTLKSQRPTVSAETAEKAAKDLERFNAKGMAMAIENGKSFVPLSADGYAAYKAAQSKWIRKGDQSLSSDEAKAINVGTASQGGFLVGEELEQGIDRVVGRYSSMRSIATVRPIGAATFKKLVKVSGTSGATRGGETTSPTEGNTPRWIELEFKPGTYLSDQRITSEALEDAVQDVESDLMEEIGIEFAEMEGNDFIFGDGLNGPRGILSYETVLNPAYEWGKVGYVKSGGANAFAAANPSDALIDLQHALKRQYRGNAVWSMNDATLGAIRKFKDGQGLYLWAPTGLQQGAVGQLLGHAVVTDDFMPDLGAGAFPIGFGDYQRAYYIIDRRGIAVLRDPYTAVPYVKFVARKRVGGGIANFEALKLLRCEA